MCSFTASKCMFYMHVSACCFCTVQIPCSTLLLCSGVHFCMMSAGVLWHLWRLPRQKKDLPHHPHADDCLHHWPVLLRPPLQRHWVSHQLPLMFIFPCTMSYFPQSPLPLHEHLHCLHLHCNQSSSMPKSPINTRLLSTTLESPESHSSHRYGLDLAKRTN